MEEKGTPTVLLFVLSITADRKYVKFHFILALTYLRTFYAYNETLKIKEVVYLEPNQAW